MRSTRCQLLLLAFLRAPCLARAEITIILDNSFIQDYKNRATIAADFVVDKAHAHPNPIPKDGDMHIAGRADQILLATVAEIMNAKEQPSALDLIHSVEGTSHTTYVAGAWRIWCEHGGTTIQDQANPPTTPFTTTNPDHVFEIHPVTQVDTIDLLDSLHPIPEAFETKDAQQAFQAYENIRCQIIPHEYTTELITSMGGYNYVEFVLELNEQPNAHPIADGHTVYCQVRDLEGELVLQRRRMVFVADSPPEAKLMTCHQGDRLHVLGIPRIDLALVHWRRTHSDDPFWQVRNVLNWNLPYEIVVVGVDSDSVEDEDIGDEH